MNKLIMSVSAAVVLCVAQAQQKESIPVTIAKNGKVETGMIVFDCKGIGHFKVGSCEKKVAITTTCERPQITTIWQQPVVITQVVHQVVTYPVIVEQPVIVQEPVVYAPTYVERTAVVGNSWGFASASIGISSYGGYYPTTYWQENNRCNELSNYRNVERAYGIGGSRGGYGYNGGRRFTGENRNSGVRAMPPLGPRMYYHR